MVDSTKSDIISFIIKSGFDIAEFSIEELFNESFDYFILTHNRSEFCFRAINPKNYENLFSGEYTVAAYRFPTVQYPRFVEGKYCSKVEMINLFLSDYLKQIKFRVSK